LRTVRIKHGRGADRTSGSPTRPFKMTLIGPYWFGGPEFRNQEIERFDPPPSTRQLLPTLQVASKQITRLASLHMDVPHTLQGHAPLPPSSPSCWCGSSLTSCRASQMNCCQRKTLVRLPCFLRRAATCSMLMVDYRIKVHMHSQAENPP
jgi:hypothetical protein